MISESAEKTLSWARYLLAADLDRRNSELPADPETIHDDAQAEYNFARLSKWLAALWPVVEGWRELSRADERIDDLLASFPEWVSLLERFNEAVSRFQPRLLENRFADLLSDLREIILWAYLLHGEFLRAYWEIVHRGAATGEQREQLRASILRLVGWIPTDLHEAQVFQAEEARREAEHVIAESTEPTGKQATELLEAVEKYERLVREALETWTSRKDDLVQRLKRRNALH